MCGGGLIGYLGTVDGRVSSGIHRRGVSAVASGTAGASARNTFRTVRYALIARGKCRCTSACSVLPVAERVQSGDAAHPLSHLTRKGFGIIQRDGQRGSYIATSGTGGTGGTEAAVTRGSCLETECGLEAFSSLLTARKTRPIVGRARYGVVIDTAALGSLP